MGNVSQEVCVDMSVCNLTHGRVVVGQGFGQLTRCQKFAAHLQVVLDLDMSRPQDTCNARLCSSLTDIHHRQNPQQH